ncbi:UDP-Glycosyltransferase/glycogen phosphorylase [Colletotrichum karsti]|uniref:UDP-Glycosyltransferase/glycogen phosphorylase n=1 Tax=Colletotrichum karsti TaxID=1095194 RepID=A0A9P6I4U7_9PEZI|nr:UDP-Glycosyltransferase/glycogen phosphorylase [Colletotrichum karsti]KAF9875051.1 UDP-Glycosyltransferase/glycogen phosphorylase [Colletotrichum karsti]
MSSTETLLSAATGPLVDGSCRRVLVVVTAGGYTNAAPVLEIARILASRGYTVEFGTLAGRETWIKDCPFVSRFHVLGPALPSSVEEAKYLQMSNWSSDNWGTKFEARKFLESSWPDVYRSLTRLAENADTRPDFILADYWVDAARDVSSDHDIPLAMLWPQMPTAMLHAPYIPGTPGLQIEVLSSEYASLWQRFHSGIAIYTSALHYYRYLRWRKKMRLEAGVSRPLPSLRKPDYLCLVNSMFGLEIAKDVPPNVAAIGPVLSDEVKSIAEPYASFLEKRRRVLYISLGTHVLLSWASLKKLLLGALAALEAGSIDGIIWPMRPMARKQMDCNSSIPVRLSQSQEIRYMSVSELLMGSHPSVLFVDFAPQRALLEDRRVAIFLSHGGPASANEALFAGVPLITLAVYFDQVQNEMRLRDAGVSIPLSKDKFSAEDVETAIGDLVLDKLSDGPIAANVDRLQKLARIASRRKSLAADLIEEVMVDSEGRRREQLAEDLSLGEKGKGWGKRKKRHMHLQPADVRMPAWKARNWDLYGLCMAATLCFVGLVVAIPVVCTR